MWPILLIILVAIYVLNPYDILPDLLVGWGWIDDIVIIGFLLRYLRNRRKKYQASQRYDQHRANTGEDHGGTGGNEDGRSRGSKEDSSSRPRDPYQILGIERGAGQETIKHAYRQLAGKYHPDKLEHLGDEFKALAEKRFKEIQRAYEELKSK